MTEPVTEKKRCPTCGSDDPNVCKLNHHWHPWSVVPRAHGRLFCCSDSFHSVPSVTEGKQQERAVTISMTRAEAAAVRDGFKQAGAARVAATDADGAEFAASIVTKVRAALSDGRASERWESEPVKEAFAEFLRGGFGIKAEAACLHLYDAMKAEFDSARSTSEALAEALGNLIRRAGAVTDALRQLEGESSDWQPAGRAKRQHFSEVQEAADALDRELDSALASYRSPHPSDGSEG